MTMVMGRSVFVPVVPLVAASLVLLVRTAENAARAWHVSDQAVSEEKLTADLQSENVPRAQVIRREAHSRWLLHMTLQVNGANSRPTRAASLSTAGLVLAAPVLVFPELFWPTLSAVPAAVGVLSLLLAVSLLRRQLSLVLISAFAVVVVVAWVGAWEHLTALSHFTNLAFGVLLMAWTSRTDTSRRLVWLTALCLGLTGVALVVGILGTHNSRTFLSSRWSDIWPELGLRLPGLSDKGVNINALGGLALVSLPVSIACARLALAESRRSPVLVGMAVLMTALSGAVCVMTQSLSVWVAIWILAIVVVWGMRRAVWRRWVALALVALPIVSVLAVTRWERQGARHGGMSRVDLQWAPRGIEAIPRLTTTEYGLEKASGTKLVESTLGMQHGLQSRDSYPPGIYRFSVEARAAERSALWLRGASPNGIQCDLANERMRADEFSTVAGSLQRLADGWYRCVMVFKATALENGSNLMMLRGSATESRYAGDGISGLHIRNLTFEKGSGPFSEFMLTMSIMLGSAKGSWMSRLELWREGLTSYLSAPWLGIGLNKYRHLDAARQSGGSRVSTMPHVHNIFLQTALDLGGLGLVTYLALMWQILIKAVHLSKCPNIRARWIGVGAGLSVASVHVFGLTDALSLGAKAGFLQWFTSGLVLAAWGVAGRTAPPPRHRRGSRFVAM